jgi:hypothetical protein
LLYGDKIVTDLSEKTYAKILAIDLMHSSQLKSAVTIFEEETQQLKANHFFLSSDPFELADSVRRFWEEQTDASCEPKVLHINHCWSNHLSRQRELLMFGIVGAPIEHQFKAQLLIRTKEKLGDIKIGTRVFQSLV